MTAQDAHPSHALEILERFFVAAPSPASPSSDSSPDDAAFVDDRRFALRVVVAGAGLSVGGAASVGGGGAG